MRRSVALLVVVAGCAGDPETDALVQGTKAVVSGEYDVVLTRPRHDDTLDMLAPGTRILVTRDRGYADRTQAEIDQELANSFHPFPSNVARLRLEKPRKYPPPHWRARFRLVDVVVQSGQHRGLTGQILRADLRPAK